MVVINFRLWELLTALHFLPGLSAFSSKNLSLNKSIMAVSLLSVTTVVFFPLTEIPENTALNKRIYTCLFSQSLEIYGLRKG